MNLRRFLDAGYALLVEEYQRLGMGLMEALEKLEPMRAHVMRDGKVETEPSESAVASQNEASMKQLQSLMGGIG